MTVRDDAKMLMAQYRFVPKEQRDFVFETMEQAIKNYDMVIFVGFEFQAPKYQDGVIDALKGAKTIDDVVEIHNVIAEMLTTTCELVKRVGHDEATPTIAASVKDFIARHKPAKRKKSSRRHTPRDS